jgi:hypothetical protein
VLEKRDIKRRIYGICREISLADRAILRRGYPGIISGKRQGRARRQGYSKKVPS